MLTISPQEEWTRMAGRGTRVPAASPTGWPPPADQTEAPRRAHSCRQKRDDGRVDTPTPPGRPQAQDLSEVERRLLPLLRELWEFGMLQPAGDGPDRYWRLSASAGARLEALVAATTAHAARPAMAFGYHCDGCGRRAVTWLVGEEHRCADCGGQPDAGSDVLVFQPLPLGARSEFVALRGTEGAGEQPGSQEAGGEVPPGDSSPLGSGRAAASA